MVTKSTAVAPRAHPRSVQTDPAAQVDAAAGPAESGLPGGAEDRAARAVTRVLRTVSPEAVEVIGAVSLMLAEAPPDTVEQFRAVTAATVPDDLDTDLWGAAPDRDDVRAGVLANLRRQFESRRDLAAASLRRAEVANLLGVSDQAVTDALDAGRLLGFKQGRRWLIPAWQLDADTERGVLPDLHPVAAAFPGGIVALSAWMTEANPDLAGRTPQELLSQGRTALVMGAVGALTSAGW